MKNSIKNYKPDFAPYTSYGNAEGERGKFLSNYRSDKDLRNSVYHAQASSTSNVALRNPYYPGTYQSTRGYDGLPIRFQDIISGCRAAYLTVGIVRNVIDLLIDFICEDLKIVHKDKKDEAFFRVWAKKVNLYDVINEMAKHFLIDANIVLKRSTAKLTTPVGQQWQVEIDEESRTIAKPDLKLYKQKRQVVDREIPVKYSFINVNALEWKNEERSDRKLVFKISPRLVNKLRSGDLDILNQFSNSLNPDDVEALKETGKLDLNMDKVYFSSMKKDSWQAWAVPFLYAALSDIKFKEKLRQAEISALDGLINVIRIWKLGDHKERIMPTSAGISNLADILQNNPGGGAIDIIWDDMLEMEEFYPPIDKILGAEKFEQVNQDILIALGVPEVLLGGKGANFSNSFIQLKTVTERIKYVRHLITDWLEKEIKLVCQAMSIETMPRIKFGQMNLDDESATKKLLVGLLDRKIISVEAVLEAYGEDFEIEIERIKRESKIFKSSNIDARSPIPSDESMAKPPAQNSGRPSNTTETQKRSQRNPKPLRGHLLPEVINKINKLDEIITDLYLESSNTENARKLTNSQTEEINNLRLALIGNIDPNDDINREFVIDTLATIRPNQKFNTYVKGLIKDYIAEKGEITLQNKKHIEAACWMSLGDENEV